ncbi:Rv1476 family membrane protein [Corynebacterium sp. CQ3829_602738]
MQTKAALEDLVSQLASSPVAFGTDNPVNAELGPALQAALADASLDTAGMIVLEQTPPVIADLRDLAQDAAAETGLDTVLVRTPQVAVGVSDSLNRAQVERGERAMVAEPDYVAGVHAFADAANGFSLNWPLVVAAVLVVLAAVAAAAAFSARRG